MIIMMIIVANIWRRMLPDLPRKPNTVAAVLSYVAGAHFCADFEGLEKANVKERDRRIVALGKRYGFGTVGTLDGTERLVVDEVGPPATQEYYGVNQKSATHSRNRSASEVSGLMNAGPRPV
jgi:hypothetical protein